MTLGDKVAKMLSEILDIYNTPVELLDFTIHVDNNKTIVTFTKVNKWIVIKQLDSGNIVLYNSENDNVVLATNIKHIEFNEKFINQCLRVACFL